MTARTRSLWLLHGVVVIFGFTGILGKLITLDAEPLVFGGCLWVESPPRFTSRGDASGAVGRRGIWFGRRPWAALWLHIG